MPQPTKNPGTIHFTAAIEQGGHDGGCWVVSPHDLKAIYGIGNLVPVVVTFDGVEYRGSIAKMGAQPLLLIRKDIRAKIGKGGGDAVDVTVTLDDKPRMVDVPTELQDALRQNPPAQATFEGLAYTHRREYAQWIAQAKQEVTKERRVAKAVDLLMNGQKLR